MQMLTISALLLACTVNGLTQVSSDVYSAPLWPDCTSVSPCICSLQIGSQTPELINKTTGTWSDVDLTNGFKTWSVWSKQSRSKGIEVQYQDGTRITSGFSKDQKTSLAVTAPGLSMQPTSIKVRSSNFFNPSLGTISPYVCKLWLSFSNGSSLTDQSDALIDTDPTTMCDNYNDREVLFEQNQKVIGFYSTSQPSGGSHPLEAIKYLGVYYQSCVDPCQYSKVTATPIADLTVTVLGATQTQTITLGTATGISCSPLVVQISEGASNPTWLSYNLINTSLTISIDAQKLTAADIGTHTLTLSASWNSVPSTLLSRDFSVHVGACELTAFTLHPTIPSQVTYTILRDQLISLTFQTTQTPACQQTVSLTADNHPWLTQASEKLMISTQSNSLHNQTLRVSYKVTPEQPSFAVTVFFDVTFISACSTASTLLDPSTPTIEAYLRLGHAAVQVAVRDTVSQALNQLNLCGSYNLAIQSIPSWLQTQVNGSFVTFTVQTDLESDLTNGLLVPFQIFLNDFTSVGPANGQINVRILSLCSSTQLLPIPSAGSLTVQLWQTETIQIDQVLDQVSLQNGLQDGVTFCNSRIFTLIESSTQQPQSFISLTESSIEISPSMVSQKGFQTFELNVSLLYYSAVAPLKVSNYLQLTILDCANAALSVSPAILPVNAAYRSQLLSQTVYINDDNYNLCGPIQVNPDAVYQWLTYDLSDRSLSIAINTNQPVNVTASFVISLVLYPSQSLRLELPVFVAPCTVEQVTTSSLPVFTLNLKKLQGFSLPQAVQIPDCGLPVTYELMPLPEGLEVEQNGNQVMLKFNEASIAGREIDLKWIASAGAVMSSAQTSKVRLEAGCQETTIKIQQSKTLTAVAGKKQSTLINVTNTLAQDWNAPSLCGRYSANVLWQSRRKLGSLSSSISMKEFDDETLQIDFNISEKIEQTQLTFTIEVYLVDYPSVPAAFSQISVNVVIPPEFSNSLPYFDDLPLSLTIQEGENWSYTLPDPAYDVLNAKSGVLLRTVRGPDSEIHIAVALPSGLRVYFEKTQRTMFLTSQLNTKPGNYTLDITLILPSKPAQLTRKYKLKLAIIPKPIFLPVPEPLIPEVKHFTAEIASISKTGLVIVRFSEDLILSDNLADVIELSKQSQSSIMNLGIESHPFTWNITGHSTNRIELKLAFESPLEVSSDLKLPDVLIITFLDVPFFRTQSGGQLDPASTRLRQTLPPQVKEDTLSTLQALQATALTVTAAILPNIVLNLLLSGSLSTLWGLINSIQIIMHTFLFNLRLPQNAQVFCSKFMFIASFNLIPTDRILDLMFNLSASDPVTSNYSELGYNSLSLFQNLGTLFFLFAAHLLGLVLMPVCKRHKHYINGGGFIRFFLEAFLQTSVSVAIGFKHPLQTGSDSFQLGLGIWLTSLIVVVPAWLFSFLMVNRHELVEKTFKKQHGSLYEGVKVESAWQIAYFSEYMFRRLGLALLIAFVDDPCLQLGTFIVMQILHVCYLAATNPSTDRLTNMQEVQNEAITMLCLYVMMGMLDKNAGGTFKAGLGSVFIGLFLGYIALNAGQMIFASIKQSIWCFKIQIAKRRMKIQLSQTKMKVRHGILSPQRKLRNIQRLEKQQLNESEVEQPNETSKDVSSSDLEDEFPSIQEQLFLCAVSQTSIEKPDGINININSKADNKIPREASQFRVNQRPKILVDLPEGFSDANVSSREQSPVPQQAVPQPPAIESMFKNRLDRRRQRAVLTQPDGSPASDKPDNFQESFNKAKHSAVCSQPGSNGSRRSTNLMRNGQSLIMQPKYVSGQIVSRSLAFDCDRPPVMMQRLINHPSRCNTRNYNDGNLDLQSQSVLLMNTNGSDFHF